MTPAPQPDLDTLLAKYITRDTHKGAVNRVRHQAKEEIERYVTGRPIDELNRLTKSEPLTDLNKELWETIGNELADLMLQTATYKVADNPDLFKQGEAYIKLHNRYRDEISALLTHTLQTYKNEIVAGIPKSYKHKVGADVALLWDSQDATDGYDQATDDIKGHINSVSKRRGIK